MASMHDIHTAYLSKCRGQLIWTLHIDSCRLAGETDSIE